MVDDEMKIERVVEYSIEYPKFKDYPLPTRIAMVFMLTIAGLLALGLIGLFAYVVYLIILL